MDRNRFSIVGSLCLVGCLPLLWGCGSGGGHFSGGAPSGVTFGAGTYFGGIAFTAASGYINGDAHLDLVLGDITSPRVSVLLGRGDGTFDAVAPVTFGILEEATTVRLGHFDGGPHLDLAVLDEDAGELHIFLGDGTGEFYPSLSGPIPIPGSVEDMGVARLDGDVYSDLVILGSAGLWVLLCDGDGTFTTTVASPIALGPNPTTLGMVDFGGDDTLDVLVGDTDDNSLRGLISDGIGGFTATAPFYLGGRPISITGVFSTCYVVTQDDVDPVNQGDLNVLEYDAPTFVGVGTTPIPLRSEFSFAVSFQGSIFSPPLVVTSGFLDGGGGEIRVFRETGSGLLTPGFVAEQADPFIVLLAGDFIEGGAGSEVVGMDVVAGAVRVVHLAPDIGGP